MSKQDVQKLYEWTSSVDPTFSNRYSIDQFESNLQDDSYVEKFQTWSGNAETSPEVPVKTVVDSLKKKDDSVDSTSQEENTDSTSTQETENTSSESSQVENKPAEVNAPEPPKKEEPTEIDPQEEDDSFMRRVAVVGGEKIYEDEYDAYYAGKEIEGREGEVYPETFTDYVKSFGVEDPESVIKEVKGYAPVQQLGEVDLGSVQKELYTDKNLDTQRYEEIMGQPPQSMMDLENPDFIQKKNEYLIDAIASGDMTKISTEEVLGNSSLFVPTHTAKKNRQIEEYIKNNPNTQINPETITQMELDNPESWFINMMGDFKRAADLGMAQGWSSSSAVDLMTAGPNQLSEEDLRKLIYRASELEKMGMSDSMFEFQKAYSESGGGTIGFLKAIGSNPQMAFETMLTSMVSMINPNSIKAMGASAPSLLAGPGGFAVMMGSANASVAAGSVFNEFITEELEKKGISFSTATPDDIKVVLSDEENFRKLRRRAAGYGIAVGFIDAIGYKIVPGVVTKIANRFGSKAAGTVAGVVTEGAIGATGEATGLAVSGQELEGVDIALEGVLPGMTSAPITLYKGLKNSASYKINGEKATRREIQDLIKNGDPRDIAGVNLEINNDESLKIEAKNSKNKVRTEAELKKGLDPRITNEKDREKLVSLELERLGLQGTKTRSGQNRIKGIESEIDAITAKYDISTEQSGVMTDQDEATQLGGELDEVVVTGKKKQDTDLETQGVTPVDTDVEIKTEPVTIKGAPDGTYLNVGMQVGTTDQKITEADIEAALPDDVNVLKKKIQLSGDNVMEDTVILEIDRPLTDSEMKDFREKTGQMAIPQLTGGKGTMFGTTDWGPFNPEFFVMPDGNQLSDTGIAVDESEQVTDADLKNDQQRRGKIRGQVLSAISALAKLVPGAEINVYNTTAEYIEATGDADPNTGRPRSTGLFDPRKNTISINLETAGLTTVPHETFHLILANLLKTELNIQNITKSMVESLIKTQDPRVMQGLSKAIKDAGYDIDVQNEEIMAQLFGVLAGEFKQLRPATQSIIKKWLDQLAKAFGLKPFTDAEIVSVLNTISGKIASGEEITSSDVEAIARKGGPVTTKKQKSQFIGVKAKLTPEQKANKKKAIQLIKQGVDPLTIKQQTGFEVGVDGKLRFELDSSQAKSKGAGVGPHYKFGMGLLGDILDFPALFEAYPKLKDIKVFYHPRYRTAGLYDGESIMINSRLIDLHGGGDHMGTLLHEIQHYIQIKEGFTGGGNPAKIRKEVQSAVNALNFNKGITLLKTALEKINILEPGLKISVGDKNNLAKLLRDNETALTDTMTEYGLNKFDLSPEAVLDIIDIIRSSPASTVLADISNKYGLSELEAKKLYDIHSVFDIKLYESLSGEVEARNVQNRRDMTEEERRNTLAEETETTLEVDSIEEGTFKEVPISREEQMKRSKENLDVVERLRKKGKSEKAIENYLKKQGLTELEISDAMAPEISVGDIIQRSNDAIKNKAKNKESLVGRVLTKLKVSLFDRQARIKGMIGKIKNPLSQKAHDAIVNKAGARGWASYRFKKAEKSIYGGLNANDIEQLDAIIYARRMVSINKSRAESGEAPYTGMDGYNEASAARDLRALEAELGSEKFQELSTRADKYFEVFADNLKRLLDSGRITQQTYDKFKNIEYSPIKVIKYIIGDVTGLDPKAIDRQAQILGMTGKDIKQLSDENENEIITDSRWLMMMSINSIESRAFQNDMIVKVNDAIQSATDEEKAAISDYVLDNPVIGKTKDGKLIRKYDKTKPPVGFVKLPFFKNGVKTDLIIKGSYADQLLDASNSKDATTRTISKLTGAGVLRFFATGGNPAFIVGNTALDFSNILFLSDVYGHVKPIAGIELGYDYVKNFLKKVGNTKNYNKIKEEYYRHGGAMNLWSTDGLVQLKQSELKTKLGQALKPFQKLLIGYGNIVSYLGETSELSFRLAVYDKVKANEIKKFKKENKRNPNDQEMEDIMYRATAEARNVMDFSQGGSVAKTIDAFMPYFNASLLGARRVTDYAQKNPVGFASSMTQASLMAGGIAATSIATLTSALRSDFGDDEEAIKAEIAKQLSYVPEYTKANYHIIFTGKKDKDGNFEYVKIKKLPIVSVATTLAENVVYSKYLPGYDGSSTLMTSTKSIPLMPDFGGDEKDLVGSVVSRNPMLSALVAYGWNIDAFRGEKVFRNPSNRPILPYAEGLYDDKVESYYKVMGEKLNISPKRTKAAIEKIVTSENTNPMVALINGAIDQTIDPNAFTDAMGQFGDVFGKKFVGYTNPKMAQYSRKDEIDHQYKVINTEKYIVEKDTQALVDKFLEENENITEMELSEIVRNNVNEDDQLRVFNKISNKLKMKDVPGEMLDFVYETDPERQAIILSKIYGPGLVDDKGNFDTQSEAFKDLEKLAKATGNKVSKKTLQLYIKRYN